MPIVMDGERVSRSLARIAHEILERNAAPAAPGSSGHAAELALVGIRTRGVPIARRLARSILEINKVEVPTGALDITLYRDDLQTVGPRPVVGPTDIPVDIEGKVVVIVDDVLYTGRTIRAALDELADFGRPRRIALAVLIDRGGRELPIQPDIVGKVVAVPDGQRIDVLVKELDEKDAVVLAPRETA
jgi:pyrimidine operon attenuation protein/uracil phosphoribosyltransferase